MAFDVYIRIYKLTFILVLREFLAIFFSRLLTIFLIGVTYTV